MTEMTPDIQSALTAVQRWWEDMGVDIPDTPPAPKVRKKAPARPKAAAPINQAPPQPEAPAGDGLEKAKSMAASAPTLDALKTVLENFDAGPLSDNARNMVFARGNAQADIMVIGESPGKQEDEAGLPFIGPAGQLLDKMLGSIGLGEDDTYITNVCNWRPPGSRNPSEEELALCRIFISRHMELCAPKHVLIVGGVSLEALTGTTGIMRNRGQWIDLPVGAGTVPALPIYHPAFLLRRPELKKHAWLDLLAFKAHLTESNT